MRLTLRSLAVAAALAAVAAVGGLWPRSAPAPEPVAAPGPQAAVEAGPHYSPFVLQMSSELPFDLISFKDVGMSVDPAHRALVYEEVAESLALTLASDADLPMSSTVLYSEAAADPSQHVACGASQIYVDVWTPEGQEQWGYSLWSGCSEEDRFAYHEVARADADDVEALARGIAASLREAVNQRCFSRRC